MPPDPPPTPTPESAPASEAGPSPVAAPGAGADSAAAAPQKPTGKDRVAFARERLRLKQERQKAKAAQTEGRAAAEKIAKELADAKAELDAASQDPVNWASKRGGKTQDDVIKAFLKGDDPVSKAEARAAAAEERAKKLEERLDREAREREEHSKKLTQQQQAELEGQAIANFVRQVTADAKRYPYLNYIFTPQDIARETRALHEWAKKEGHRYSYDEVATYFDNRAKTRYDELKAREKDLFPSESAPEPEKGKKGQAARGSTPAKTSQATAPAPRETPRKVQARLTREEQEQEDLRILREASAKDRAAAEAANKRN